MEVLKLIINLQKNKRKLNLLQQYLTNKNFTLMKKILIISMLLLFTNLNAQFWKSNKLKGNGIIKTETRTIGSFGQLSIIGPFDIELISGKEKDIQVTADENILEKIETKIKNNKLLIKINSKTELSNYTKLHIKIPVKSLSKIKLLGSAEIYSNNSFNWDEIEFHITGSGEIKLNIISEYILAIIKGSGEIKLTGSTNKTSCKTLGSGTIDTKELISKETEAKVVGSGEIYVMTKKDIKASVTGSGSIYYYGNPQKVNVKILGSGEVIQK
jgi:hypothetical protein